MSALRYGIFDTLCLLCTDFQVFGAQSWCLPHKIQTAQQVGQLSFQTYLHLLAVASRVAAKTEHFVSFLTLLQFC